MKKKNDPLITVYITNYNYGNFLDKAIKSVLNQSYKKFELIIIDDGSTDNSKKILEKYNNNKKIIKIIFQKNKGLLFSNNVALKMSKGEYITRLDADDWLDQNFLQVMVNEIKKNRNIGMIFCNYYIVNKSGEIQDQFFRHNFKNVKLLDQPAHGACSLINVKCLKNVGGYNQNLRSQDGVDIWIKLILKFKVVNVNLPLFYYRQHGKNLTYNKIKLYQSRDKVFDLNSKKKKRIIRNTICIIPIRGNNENSIALKKINSKTVINMIINNILETKLIKKIFVSSPDDKILNHIRKINNKKLIALKRDENLAGFNISIKETLKQIIKKFEKKIKIDSVFKVNVDHPLMDKYCFSSMINLMNIYETNEVIAVKKEQDNFFYHNGTGFIPFKHSNNLTLEREEVYRQIGSLHLYDKKSIIKELKNKKIGHLILDDISSHHVKSNLDFKVCKTLLRYRLKS